MADTAGAKTYLRILTADFDDEVEMKLPMAVGIVVDYMTRDAVGDDETAVVDAAIYEVMKSLMGQSDGPPLSNDVKNILRRFRDPPLA